MRVNCRMKSTIHKSFTVILEYDFLVIRSDKMPDSPDGAIVNLYQMQQMQVNYKSKSAVHKSLQSSKTKVLDCRNDLMSSDDSKSWIDCCSLIVGHSGAQEITQSSSLISKISLIVDRMIILWFFSVGYERFEESWRNEERKKGRKEHLNKDNQHCRLKSPRGDPMKTASSFHHSIISSFLNLHRNSSIHSWTKIKIHNNDLGLSEATEQSNLFNSTSQSNRKASKLLLWGRRRPPWTRSTAQSGESTPGSLKRWHFQKSHEKRDFVKFGCRANPLRERRKETKEKKERNEICDSELEATLAKKMPDKKPEEDQPFAEASKSLTLIIKRRRRSGWLSDFV